MFYNSLGFSRKEIVRLYVSDRNIEVTDASGKVVPSQVDPFWLNNEDVATNVFKVISCNEYDYHFQTVSASYAVGHGFELQLGYTKDHH